MAGVTEDHCREMQGECSRSVFAAIEKIREDTRNEIGKIREAVQNIDRSVARIMGWAGLNGNATPPVAHRRDSEELEHLHRRITDLLDQADAKSKSDVVKSGESITIPRWVLVPVGVFIIIVLAIAMVAGERGLTFLPKNSIVVSAPTGGK